jgi:alpha-L-fucosidase
MKLTTILLCSLCSLPIAGRAGDALDQWRSLGYGMFIHYGLSTFTGNEHQKTKVDPAVYAPTNLDVEQWIRVARDAGMKYAVLTAKHTAGHCLWDSRITWQGREFDYDVASGSDTTDVVGAFVNACRKHALTPGLYYCLEDYVNNSSYRDGGPGRGARNLPADFYQLVRAQLTELLTRYPAVTYIWLDIPVQASAPQRVAIYRMIKRQHPGTVVLYNHGTAKPKRPMTIANTQRAWPTDAFNTERWPLPQGWFNEEQTWKGRTYRLGYEHCDTIGKTWFWHPDDRPRPVSELARLYRDVRAAGGNLLLNVPPDPTGRIPGYYVEALMELKQEMEAPPPADDPPPAGSVE